jgi:hypothetical protein
MTRYDKFFAAQGFSQSIVDRRVFYKRLAGGRLFIVAVYVDDNWTVCDDDDEWDIFHAAWKQEFVEFANVEAAADDFCGVTTIDLPDGSVAMSSKKLLLSMQASIDEYPRPAHIGTPMLGDSPALMREKGGAMTSSVLAKAVMKHDSLTTEVLQRAAHYLGLHAASLVNAFDPEALIYGGGVIEGLGEWMLGQIRTTALQYVINRNRIDAVKIIEAKLGDDAGVVGAALLALE